MKEAAKQLITLVLNTELDIDEVRNTWMTQFESRLSTEEFNQIWDDVMSQLPELT